MLTLSLFCLLMDTDQKKYLFVEGLLFIWLKDHYFVMLICLVIYLQDLKTHIKCFKICYIFVNPTLLVKNYLCIYLIFYIILK
jgi:hypothetical protein